MKVIEKGKREKWALEVRCTGNGNGEKEGACGALLEVEADDIFQTSSHPYGDSSPTYYYTIECPQCKTWTDIPNKIPDYIKDEARSRHRYPDDRKRNRIDQNEK